MSGGSYDYLYCKETSELFQLQNIANIDDMATVLRRKGYEDVARDMLRLAEYLKSAWNRVDVLSDQLKDVMRSVEWYESCDFGDNDLERHINDYREGKEGDPDDR